MSNITIGWNNSTPTDSDLVGQGDDVIRSVKSNVQGMLDAEHFFPSVGGAAGAHRRGSARVFVGPSSQVSSADTDGRLMWNSTTSQLNYLSSNTSIVIGGRYAAHVEQGIFNNPTLGGNEYFAFDSGRSAAFASRSSKQFYFANGALSTFTGTPIVMVTLEDTIRGNDTAVHAPIVGSVNGFGFSVYWGGIANESLSTTTLSWLALGRKAYP